ncbi:MAG: hypothetical protein CW691_07530 [Candidatus Bathyarchaeum sp.]|nr:MAG: hypothetical protein CW691_07530 [Candidatus Bathyarchaeum sp.]
MWTITFRRLRKDRRGVSNIIVVALSLVIMLAIVSDIVLWNYEMNQVDWEKMKEDVTITNVEQVTSFSWFNTQNEYEINTGSIVSGSYTSTQAVDGVFERLIESSSLPCNPSAYALIAPTSLVSGSVSNLVSDNGDYMTFRSYPSETDSSDFVDNNKSDVDTSEDKGTHSSFPAQQSGPDKVMDTLQETNSGGGSGEWISPTGHENGGELWYYETRVYDDNEGTYAYAWVPARSWSNYLVLTHNELTTDTIRYLMQRQTVNIDQIEVDIYIDKEWKNVYSGSATWEKWTNVTFDEASVTQMRFRFHNDHPNQYRWVIFYETDFLQSKSNYELDLEVQWTKVNHSETNEELCIYCGKMGLEDLQVDVWTGSTWETVFKELSTGWNNASISSYLESSIFTIRFKGVSEANDSIQDSWNIDAALLHVWSQEHTLGVEFEGTSGTEDWSQLTWMINSAWTTGSVEVTMQLFDYTLGAYPTSGEGYLNYVSSSTANTDETKTQIITSNPGNFRDASGQWKLRIIGAKATGTSFDFKADMVELSPQDYQLDMDGTFIIDTATHPLENIQSFEIQLRYKAYDALEQWYLKAYNWSSSTYSDAGFNVTSGHRPTMGWDYYALNLTSVWQSYVNSEGIIKIKLVDQGADNDQTAVDIDFLGVRVKMDGQQFTFKNGGSLTVRLVSLWIINSTSHQHYDVDVFINSAAIKDYVRYDFGLQTGNYIVKVVTERGNTAVFSIN